MENIYNKNTMEVFGRDEQNIYDSVKPSATVILKTLNQGFKSKSEPSAMEKCRQARACLTNSKVEHPSPWLLHASQMLGTEYLMGE
jgi:hypothetical protein